MPKSGKMALFGGTKTVTSSYQERWPIIDEDEVNAVVQLTLAGELSINDGSGVLNEFENKFAAYHDVRYALVQTTAPRRCTQPTSPLA